MSQQKLDTLPIGLSEAEKDDLETMIGEFRRQRRINPATEANEPLQAQLDSITQRIADLTETVLKIDRRMAPLVEINHLSHRKSELLNERLDAVIVALKKGNVL